MLTIVSVPAGAVNDLMANTGQLFGDLWLVITLAVGLPLAFYIIKKVISLVPKGR